MNTVVRQNLRLPAGMTLIELLVVVALLGAIAVTVLPNLANTAEDRRNREAVRTVSTFIAKAQSRAVGRREWSGFMLTTTNTTSFAAMDLFLADVPAVYRGDTVPALLTITASSSTTRTVGGTNGELLLSGTWTGGAGVRPNDLIRFNSAGPFYEIDSNTTTTIRFEPRGFDAGANEDAGYQLHNTPWPPTGVPLSFEIIRQPVVAGSPVTLAEGRAVDLRWSGCGPPILTVGSLTFSGTSTPYRLLTSSTSAAPAAGATTSVLFDGTGRLRQVIVRAGSVTRRITVTGPVYLLVGRADRVGQQPATLNANDDSLGANWQYPDSYWVAIDPATGIVKIAECMPNAAGTTAIDQCLNSQTWIRQALLGDAR
jgi:prepilin-type N-terminal cleavage/methylation domain-containing protein